MIDFQNLTPPKRPNYCIVAPGRPGERWLAPQQYDVPVDVLQQAWQRMIVKQPRVKVLQSTEQQIVYVQRSRIFRFKDIVVVEFVKLADQQSSIYLYSHSVLGYSDFGVNCQRVKQWLSALENCIDNQCAST